MYQVQFVATTSAGWNQSLKLINDDTNRPLDTTDLSFELAISDSYGHPVLTASTDEETIATPGDGVVTWRFTPAQMSALCPGTTYRVGATVTNDGNVTQLFVGTLAFIDGEVQ